MSSEISPKYTPLIKIFKFSYPTCTNEEVFFHLEIPIEIPYNGSTMELVQRVINMFHVPVYLENELNEELAKYVRKETKDYQNKKDEDLLNQFKNNEINVESVVKNWEKLFKDNVLEYADQKGTSDEEVFAMAYHKLVHSPALETILQVESSYANTVAETLKNRDEDIKKLTQNQTDEMEEQVRLLNTFTTEDDINELACKQFEAQALVTGRWGSQLDALSQTQRAQYRSWLMTILDECQTNDTASTPSNSPLGTFTKVQEFPSASNSVPRLEDSFTIHLGSQLKQSHNLRIVSMDVMDLCRPNGDYESPPCNRMQTALSLYSNDLSGVVLLCEESSRPGASVAFDKITKAVTEYHFATIDAQLNEFERIIELKEKSSDTSEESPSRRSRRRYHSGDIFVTKHSNLADAHVLFHLVVGDDLKSGDINSRHPVIMGLRNILKTACSNDITSISLPLLLKYELSDEMTASWCLKRAELVLKCVKGFMLETATWGGAELRNIRFIAPAGLSPDLFQSLASLLPNIFRISNPLKFKGNS